MPSSSPAQRRLMAARAHGWVPDRLKHPPSVAVAKEFNDADKKQHRKRGIAGEIEKRLGRR